MNEVTILIADDDPVARQMLNDKLGRAGYRIVTARTGREALAMATTDPPHLFILDWVMPEMDGLELCRNLKADEQLSRVPIIVLTARSNPADQKVCEESGANLVLTKPVSLRLLLKHVQALLPEDRF